MIAQESNHPENGSVICDGKEIDQLLIFNYYFVRGWSDLMPILSILVCL